MYERETSKDERLRQFMIEEVREYYKNMYSIKNSRFYQSYNVDHKIVEL